MNEMRYRTTGHKTQGPVPPLKDLSVMQFKDLEIYDMSATNGPGDAIPEGFNLAEDIRFTLGSSGVTDLDAKNAGKDSDGNIYIKMQDELALGKLTITKKGEIINDLGLILRTANVLVHAFEWVAGTLKNVTFDIYADEDIVVNGVTIFTEGQKISSITTGADGVAVLEGLPAGQYYAMLGLLIVAAKRRKNA